MGPVASAAYNVVMILRFEGPLEPALLERAIELTAERQEVLRAYFAEDDGQPFTRIAERHLGRLERLELPQGDGDTAARALTAELAAEPFDLPRPPLLRTVLLPGGGRHYLAVIAHHTIMDGWSLGIFIQEVQAFYRAERRGEAAGLPPLRSSFAELVARDRGAKAAPSSCARSRPGGAASEGAPAILELPPRPPRPAAKQYAGAIYMAPHRDITVEQVRELGRSQRTTFFAPLFAAFAVVLWRLGGRPDVVIGTPTTSRPTARPRSAGRAADQQPGAAHRVVDPAEAGFGALVGPAAGSSCSTALGDAEVPSKGWSRRSIRSGGEDIDPALPGDLFARCRTCLRLDSFYDDDLRADSLRQARPTPPRPTSSWRSIPTSRAGSSSRSSPTTPR